MSLNPVLSFELVNILKCFGVVVRFENSQQLFHYLKRLMYHLALSVPYTWVLLYKLAREVTFPFLTLLSLYGMNWRTHPRPYHFPPRSLHHEGNRRDGVVGCSPLPVCSSCARNCNPKSPKTGQPGHSLGIPPNCSPLRLNYLNRN